MRDDDYDVSDVLEEKTEEQAETTEAPAEEVKEEPKVEQAAPPVIAEPEQETVVLETPEEPKAEVLTEGDMTGNLYVIRTTANREDQVFDFLQSNIEKKNIPIFSIVRAHGMRGYIFIEAEDDAEAQRAIYGVPYARGLLPKPVGFGEIEHMLETVKTDVNIRKGDIVEIISGPFKREKAKISRVDKQKEDVIVELLEAAVSIPITLKFDAVKVIRREDEEGDDDIVFDE